MELKRKHIVDINSETQTNAARIYDEIESHQQQQQQQQQQQGRKNKTVNKRSKTNNQRDSDMTDNVRQPNVSGSISLISDTITRPPPQSETVSLVDNIYTKAIASSSSSSSSPSSSTLPLSQPNQFPYAHHAGSPYMVVPVPFSALPFNISSQFHTIGVNHHPAAAGGHALLPHSHFSLPSSFLPPSLHVMPPSVLPGSSNPSLLLPPPPPLHQQQHQQQQPVQYQLHQQQQPRQQRQHQQPPPLEQPSEAASTAPSVLATAGIGTNDQVGILIKQYLEQHNDELKHAKLQIAGLQGSLEHLELKYQHLLRRLIASQAEIVRLIFAHIHHSPSPELLLFGSLMIAANEYRLRSDSSKVQVIILHAMRNQIVVVPMTID
jgi:hypothetical protein